MKKPAIKPFFDISIVCCDVDILANACALAGPSPKRLSRETKKPATTVTGFSSLAEDMGLEPTGLLRLT